MTTHDGQSHPPLKGPVTRPAAHWFALIVLAASQFMVILDSTIMNIALPSIQRSLNFSLTDLQWVINLYTLACGGFLLLAGRVADRFGRRLLFIAGLLLFTLASLFGGFAQSSGWLVAARGVQGLGAAMIAATALAILTTTFPEGPERNRALGIWGGIATVGAAVGVTLGGVLTSGISWRWVLFVNVPVGLLAAALTPRAVIEHRAPGRAGFDIAGAVTITAGLGALVYGIVRTTAVGWVAPSTVAVLVLAVVLLVAFVVIERHVPAPLVPLTVFRRHSITGANLAGFVVPVGPIAGFYFISLYLQQVLGYSALRAGCAFLPFAFVALITSLGVSGRVLNRFGARVVLTVGMMIIAVGILLLTQISEAGNYRMVVLPGTIVIAFGMILAFSASTIAATAGESGADAGLFSGLINTANQIGAVLGLAILTTVVASHTIPIAGFRAAFVVGAVVEVVGAVIAFALVRGQLPERVRDTTETIAVTRAVATRESLESS